MAELLGKICSTCKEEKSLENYYNSKASIDGKGYRCKACDDIARKAYREKHRGFHLKAQRERNWRHKYGLEREDFERMWEDQEGKCSICFVHLTNIELDNDPKNKSNTACVDHCHATGKVRSLLCARCNKGLGLFDDETDKVKAAYEYLIFHEIH